MNTEQGERYKGARRSESGAEDTVNTHGAEDTVNTHEAEAFEENKADKGCDEQERQR